MINRAMSTFEDTAMADRRSVSRSPWLAALVAISLPAVVGCEAPRTDFGGAVVVPEPGTTATIEGTQDDTAPDF
jgi:hypothetical protein